MQYGIFNQKINTNLALVKPLIHLRIQELVFKEENCIYILSLDGMVYKWGPNEVS